MRSRRHVTVVALHGAGGGSFNLVRAINAHSSKYKAALVTSAPSTYDFGDGIDVCKRPKRVAPLLDGAKRLFICDCGGLLTLAKYLCATQHREVRWEPDHPASRHLYAWLAGKSTVFFWSGTHYLAGYEAMNARVATLRCGRRYAMCDLLRFDDGAMPLMQPFEGIGPSPKKFPRFTIGHSPGHKYAADKKGSSIIEGVARSLRKSARVGLLVLRNVPHARALSQKGMCHLFIDQIAPQIGGIGKSGLEAMLMRIPTLCDIRHSKYTGYYSGMPVQHVGDAESLTDALRTLLSDKRARAELADACFAWAQRLKFQPTAAYLDETLVWA